MKLGDNCVSPSTFCGRLLPKSEGRANVRISARYINHSKGRWSENTENMNEFASVKVRLQKHQWRTLLSQSSTIYIVDHPNVMTYMQLLLRLRLSLQTSLLIGMDVASVLGQPLCRSLKHPCAR